MSKKLSDIDIEQMSLDDCWRWTIEMYEYITINLDNKLKEGMDEMIDAAIDLKYEWVENNVEIKVLNKTLDKTCFFCYYASKSAPSRWNKCLACPGRLVDVNFSCQNDEYDYAIRPYKFLAKIKALNQKRKDGVK